MNFKLTIATAVLSASVLSPAQAQTIELRPIFSYSFEPSDLTRFDINGGGYNIRLEIESTYSGSNPQAGLYVSIFDDKNLSGPGYSFDLFPSGGTINFDIPHELINQLTLGWADGIGSLQVYSWGGPITLNRLYFRVTAPTVGYFKDLQLSAVPEPSSIGLLMAGLLSARLVLHRRRRQ